LIWSAAGKNWYYGLMNNEEKNVLSTAFGFFDAGIKPIRKESKFGQVLELEAESCQKLAQVRTGFGFGGVKLSEVSPSSDRFWSWKQKAVRS
jgi:hypothetical protein